MTKKIICAVMAAAVLAACEKKESVVVGEEKEMVTLEVKIPEEMTKAVNVGSEDAVSKYQIMVYDTDTDLLEAYTIISGTSTSATVSCTTGPKEIVVLANAPDMESVTSLSTLKETRSRLEHNTIGSLVMEGSKPVDLTVSSTVEVELNRIVSKVRLSSVNVDFENDAYDAMSFEIVSAYLINVPADKKYLVKSAATQVAKPSEWYNKLAYEANSAYDGILKDMINVSSTKNYQTHHVFYSYPNPHLADDFSSTWSERPTRLVVEAKLGGVLYYYPIKLPQLEQNKMYDVSLNITRPGKTTPYEDMKKHEETFTIKVIGWGTGGTLSEIL